jgi:hypothetical protein
MTNYSSSVAVAVDLCSNVAVATNDLYCIIYYMLLSMLIITATSVKIIFNHDHEKMNEQCTYVFNRYS